MVQLFEVGSEANIPYKYYKCDDISDLDTIDIIKAGFGAEAYIIHSADVYMLDSLGKWILQ